MPLDTDIEATLEGAQSPLLGRQHRLLEGLVATPPDAPSRRLGVCELSLGILADLLMLPKGAKIIEARPSRITRNTGPTLELVIEHEGILLVPPGGELHRLNPRWSGAYDVATGATTIDFVGWTP